MYYICVYVKIYNLIINTKNVIDDHPVSLTIWKTVNRDHKILSKFVYPKLKFPIYLSLLLKLSSKLKGALQYVLNIIGIKKILNKFINYKSLAK